MFRRRFLNILIFVVFNCISLIFFLLSTALQASEVKQHAWELDAEFIHMNLKHNDTKLIGNGGAVQFGYGFVKNSWKYATTVDVILGPYTRMRGERIKTDFYGTGIGLKCAYDILGWGFRSTTGSLGLSLSLDYSDIVGRSVSPSRESVDGRVIDELSIRVSNFGASAGLVYGIFEPARQLGNTRELLVTRIEGYSVGANFLLPIKTSYTSTYRQRTRESEGGEFGDDEQKKDRGSFNGYGVNFVLTAYLGT